MESNVRVLPTHSFPGCPVQLPVCVRYRARLSAFPMIHKYFHALVELFQFYRFPQWPTVTYLVLAGVSSAWKSITLVRTIYGFNFRLSLPLAPRADVIILIEAKTKTIFFLCGRVILTLIVWCFGLAIVRFSRRVKFSFHQFLFCKYYFCSFSILGFGDRSLFVPWEFSHLIL